MNVLADASLPGLKEAFPHPFHLTVYHNIQELTSFLNNQDILVCRSTLKVNSQLLDQSALKYVATASSGTDHLDLKFLRAQNIQVIDAKGCNATAVADYVISCLAYLKKQQISLGENAGVIGMGRVGRQVHARLKALRFDIKTYDPPRSAFDKSFESCSLSELYDCDLLCIHPELHHVPPYPSFNLINDEFLSHTKANCVLLNASRGGVVDEKALLSQTKPLIYCTDVYLNEPELNPKIIQRATLATPHIAGHSLEAKYLAVEIISQQIHAAFHLPSPQYAIPPKPSVFQYNPKQPWEEQVLAIYNPVYESNALKKTDAIKTKFQALRKQHKTRHNFSTYFEWIDEPDIRRIIGCSPHSLCR